MEPGLEAAFISVPDRKICLIVPCGRSSIGIGDSSGCGLPRSG